MVNEASNNNRETAPHSTSVQSIPNIPAASKTMRICKRKRDTSDIDNRAVISSASTSSKKTLSSKNVNIINSFVLHIIFETYIWCCAFLFTFELYFFFVLRQ